jgi:hypothetical protein
MMNIWQLNSVSNDYTPLIHATRQDAIDGIALTNGKPKHWLNIPMFEPFREKSKKKQKPLADISYIAPGSVVLNLKAYGVLKDFLSQFGELLEVECVNAGGLLGDLAKDRETHYFYNVTNIIPCIDGEHSEKRGTAIVKPVFVHDAIPKDAQIFKDPLRVRTDIYFNASAKASMESIIKDAGLTGAYFFQG